MAEGVGGSNLWYEDKAEGASGDFTFLGTKTRQRVPVVILPLVRRQGRGCRWSLPLVRRQGRGCRLC